MEIKDLGSEDDDGDRASIERANFSMAEGNGSSADMEVRQRTQQRQEAQDQVSSDVSNVKRDADSGLVGI